ncbi:arylsulfatase [Bythopirellula goksoeyrii]|uniref:Arylsulfatase n=1 Tax=Bythopirellula goksoeyrii TaxID=1400387 RepID=A0A5B9QIF4_9BACT|nr:arylsulfatase [Bythopirellula goksoeyrii]QEG34011.1 Arylsulfatase [Bythopirellula goksoeyrii]
MARAAFLGLLLVTLFSLQVDDGVAAQQPNIVFILADDLGYGDLGCFGQKQIATPHLDKMAADGMKLTQHYAGSTVCAPSRCVLMTGKHSGHVPIRDNRNVSPTSNKPLPDDEVTIAELLQEQGYATALIGKWGLGDQHNAGFPNQQGFDYTFGYLDQSHAHNYFPEFLFRNGERVTLRNFVPAARPSGAGVASEKVDYSHDRIAEEAHAWLRLNHRKPFFLYLAVTLPHANNEAGSRGQETPDFGQYADRDWPDSQKGTASMITRLDETVGQVRELLELLGVEENTIVVFSSDNGPHAEGGNDPAYFHSSGPLRGIKRDLYEGGIRVPTIVAWPGQISPGHVEDTVSAFQDWLPTFAELAGSETPSDIDGISLVPMLTGQGEQAQHDFLYWEFFKEGGKRAIRSGDWKGVQLGMKQSRKPIELYDLRSDLSEEHDLADEHPEVVARLERLMDSAHSDSGDYSFRD